MKWRFNLGPFGTKLRGCINDGDEGLESCKKTLDALDKCYAHIKTLVSEDEWEEINMEYETVKEHIAILSIDDEATRQDRLEDEHFYGYNQPLECVNEDLRIFYDLCDDYRIWIGV